MLKPRDTNTKTFQAKSQCPCCERDKAIKQRILKVICALIDIYEKEDAEERELNSEITTLINDLAAKELEVEYLKSKMRKEEKK